MPFKPGDPRAKKAGSKGGKALDPQKRYFSINPEAAKKWSVIGGKAPKKPKDDRETLQELR